MPHTVECFVKVHKSSQDSFVVIQGCQPAVGDVCELLSSRAFRKEAELVFCKNVPVDQVSTKDLALDMIEDFSHCREKRDWSIVGWVFGFAPILEDRSNNRSLPVVGEGARLD